MRILDWLRTCIRRDRRWQLRAEVSAELLEVRALLSGVGLEGGEAESTSGHTHGDDHGEHADRPYVPPTQRLTSAGRFLSAPSTDAPLDIAVGFLANHADQLDLTVADVSQFRVTDQYVSPHNGVTHIYLQQTHNDLLIANTSINVNVAASGEVINVGSSFVSGVGALDRLANGPHQAELAPEQALAAFVQELGMGSVAAESFVSSILPESEGGTTLIMAPHVAAEDVIAELQYVPTPSGDLELVWRLNVQTRNGDHWYDANVSAVDGSVYAATDWVSHATYNVYPAPNASPDDGGRVGVTDPPDITASPFGWHDTNGVAGAEHTITRGNNVYAYLDRDGNDQPDALDVDGGAGLVFDFPLSLAAEPDTYQEAAVTNLFYWTNLLHDVHDQYGFDEASGNFQATNYSGHGLGGDSLLAEAQDGALVGNRNNANMTTPPDGQSPRLQMYVWNTSAPGRDGALDASIIVHEYGHGVTTRLTGGPGNSGSLQTVQSGGLGEGWSDFHALMFTQNMSHAATDARGIGTYALNQPPDGPGIRSVPYSYDMSINPHTFGDLVNGGSDHRLGEIWATVLWDLNWAFIDGSSLDAALPNAGLGFDPDLHRGTGGNNLALQLIMDGLKLQPANPSFLDARDAILAADLALTGGIHQSTIWTVFARRGMGYSADDGGGSTTTDVTEAFDLPAIGRGSVTLGSEHYEIGETIAVELRDSHLVGAETVNVSVTTAVDSENLVLFEDATVKGIFRGNLLTSGALAELQDGTLQIAGDDVITVAYEDADDGGGAAATVMDTASVLVLTDIFVADFSDGFGSPSADGFVASGSTSQWHLSTGRGLDPGHSADDSFYFGSGEGLTGGGQYANNASGTLTSPEIDLSLATSAHLAFNHFLQSEARFDVARVQVLTASATTEIYKSGFDGFSPSTNGFEELILDLDAFVGQSVRIVFQFSSDFSANDEGWYVDDVRVRAVAPPPLDPSDLVGTAFSIQNPHAVLGQSEVTYAIANTGGLSAGTFSTHIVQSGNNILGDADDTVVLNSHRLIAGLAGGSEIIVNESLQLDQAVLYANAVMADAEQGLVGTLSADIGYLFLVIDTEGDVIELNEANNFGQGQHLDSGRYTYFPWDLNGDGVVTPVDAITAIHSLGGDASIADLDGNGVVTPIETLAVIQRIGYQRNPDPFVPPLLSIQAGNSLATALWQPPTVGVSSEDDRRPNDGLPEGTTPPDVALSDSDGSSAAVTDQYFSAGTDWVEALALSES